ncbi:transaldolase [Neoasaia chiangmaiensis]|uniref:Transaldolase n=2 Tax=Neoasaia chiangmaiensis TaxID=320497 RepID=A0A1U9KTS9_9PROT|nr:transaldolase [Neoasaia chiangmaiensis]
MLQKAPHQKTRNPLKELVALGQSPWLDYINRTHTEEGELKRLVEEDGLRGMTSNPAIFEKTMGYGHAYDAQIKSILARRKVGAGELYEELAVTDIRAACDTLHPVFESSKGQDGHVSIEVSPHLAHDAEGTIKEARRLWKAVDRRNLMIKIPGTPAGAKAIEQATADGISTNVTLLFSQKAYHETFNAYIKGLERRVADGEDVSRIASVASFYIGRVDLLVDEQIDRKIAAKDVHTNILRALRGKIAIANATLAYAHWQEVSRSDRWRNLAAAGANAQRLLWASTSTKDKTYSDVIYVDELIAPDTVNTMPLPTFEAFRDHGNPSEPMVIDVADAKAKLDALAKGGIDLHAITDKLLRDGLAGFNEAFDKLHTVLKGKIEALAA